MADRTLAEQIAQESELLRRRHVHYSRKRGQLTLDEAVDLCRRMSGLPTRCPWCRKVHAGSCARLISGGQTE